ncbi:MAG: hypothetical protein U9Q15_05385 [Patescibacteria group bacterium]|nr:hypothetical protein [Patescibacteria group bacterium]
MVGSTTNNNLFIGIPGQGVDLTSINKSDAQNFLDEMSDSFEQTSDVDSGAILTLNGSIQKEIEKVQPYLRKYAQKLLDQFDERTGLLVLGKFKTNDFPPQEKISCLTLSGSQKDASEMVTLDSKFLRMAIKLKIVTVTAVLSATDGFQKVA